MKRTTLRFIRPKVRLELEVEIKSDDAHEGQLTTALEPLTGPVQRLTISMGQWERRGPRSPWREAMFGQCHEVVERFAAEQCSGPTRAALERLCEIWREWHLNDLSSGTDAQRAALEDMPRDTAIDWYTQACDYLATRGLLTDRGYKFGSRWLVRPLPAAIVAEVEDLVTRLPGDG